jgi:hypothetical protein
MKFGDFSCNRSVILVVAWLCIAQCLFPALAFSNSPPTFRLSVRDYLNPNTGRFWTMDSYEGNNNDPRSLQKYLYAQDNAVNGIDPSGLKTYLLLYGQDRTSTIFRDQARLLAGRIKTTGTEFCSYQSSDTIVTQECFNVRQMIKAFRDTKDIGYIAYLGHGGPSALYMGNPQGAEYNLSPWGGAVDEASDSTSVDELPTINVRSDAEAELYSCYSGAAEPGCISMAKAFSDHFGIRVVGAGAGVGFDNNGPYIRGYRKIIAAPLRALVHRDVIGIGGWQLFTPDM